MREEKDSETERVRERESRTLFASVVICYCFVAQALWPPFSFFHVFCIVLSPIYPNIKTDASSQTNDRPMYSTWFFFGLYDLVFFKMHKLLLASGINCLHVYLFPRLPIYPIPGWKDGWWPSTPDWQPLQTPTRVKKRRKEWPDHQDAHHPHACITLITKTIIITNILITTAFSPVSRPSLKDRKSDH